MATIKVPGVGPVQSKYVYIGGAVIAGIAAYSYYRASQAPADEELVLDATEMPTEDAELQYGDAYGTDYAPDGSGYGYGGGYAPPYYTPSNPDAPRDPVTDNEWASEALEHLSDVGIDRQAASLAISRYRLRDCLTPAQMDIVRQAVGRFGPPPQSGTLQMTSCPGGTTPPPPTTGNPVTPGMPAIRATSISRTAVKLDWPHVTGSNGYTMYRNGSRIVSVVYSGYTFTGLKPNTTYRLGAATIGTGGKSSGVKTVTVRTKK